MTTTIYTPKFYAAHVVLDIETLDVLPTAKVISIGAAAVSASGVLVASFHTPISTISQQLDRTESEETHTHGGKQCLAMLPVRQVIATPKAEKHHCFLPPAAHLKHSVRL